MYSRVALLKTRNRHLFVKTHDYLVTVYYYLDFFELDPLPDMTAATVINCLKQHFAARHGTQEVVVKDKFKAVEFHQSLTRMITKTH